MTSLLTDAEVAHEELLQFVDRHRLKGRGLGLVDVHLLASSKRAAIPLWTLDRRLREAAAKLDATYC